MGAAAGRMRRRTTASSGTQDAKSIKKRKAQNAKDLKNYARCTPFNAQQVHRKHRYLGFLSKEILLKVSRIGII